jgi:hypothetical protein
MATWNEDHVSLIWTRRVSHRSKGCVFRNFPNDGLLGQLEVLNLSSDEESEDEWAIDDIWVMITITVPSAEQGPEPE